MNRIDTEASRNYVTQFGLSSTDWSDKNGHGTHCAGIVVAEPRQAVMSGLAPCAEIVVKRVTEGVGSEDNIQLPLRITAAIRCFGRLPRN